MRNFLLYFELRVEDEHGVFVVYCRPLSIIEFYFSLGFIKGIAFEWNLGGEYRIHPRLEWEVVRLRQYIEA